VKESLETSFQDTCDHPFSVMLPVAPRSAKGARAAGRRRALLAREAFSAVRCVVHSLTPSRRSFLCLVLAASLWAWAALRRRRRRGSMLEALLRLLRARLVGGLPTDGGRIPGASTVVPRIMGPHEDGGAAENRARPALQASQEWSSLATAIARASFHTATSERRRREELALQPSAFMSSGEDESVTLHPFHENRDRLLTGDPRSLETMEPFARLCLKASRIRHLRYRVAFDPYVQVFINDVPKGRSHKGIMSDSTWIFEVALDIFSPLSIIRVAVMDRSVRKKGAALLGFVEFRVAELVPNGNEVSGWFELRCADKLKGKAPCRLEKHKLARDDAVDTTMNISSGSEAPPMLSSLGWLTKLFERFRWISSSEGKSSARVGGARHISSCSVRGRDSLWLNAGEMHLAVRLEAKGCAPLAELGPGTPPRRPSRLALLLCALLLPRRFRRLRLDDEWYACCFPWPEFRSESSSDDGWFYLKGAIDLQREFSRLRSIVLDQIVFKFGSAASYVFQWQSRGLSSCALSNLWLCCCWPWCFLPSVPLWVAICVYLLRDPGHRCAILAHEATAPLNREGYAMVAAFDSTKRMVTWLERIISEHGGRPKMPQELHELAKLTFQDGRPTLPFDALLAELRQVPWIAWSRRGYLRQCQYGHDLVLLGSGSYQQDCVWRCCGDSSGECSEIDRASIGLHLGVDRYHCAICKIDVCDSCVSGQRESFFLEKVPVPVCGLETLRASVHEMEDSVKGVRILLDGILRNLGKLLNPNQKEAALYAYLSCAVTSVALAGLHLLLQSHFAWLLQLSWLVAGTLVFTRRALWARRLVTVYRATRDFVAIHAMRARGGTADWAFFSPDTPVQK